MTGEAASLSRMLPDGLTLLSQDLCCPVKVLPRCSPTARLLRLRRNLTSSTINVCHSSTGNRRIHPSIRTSTERPLSARILGQKSTWLCDMSWRMRFLVCIAARTMTGSKGKLLFNSCDEEKFTIIRECHSDPNLTPSSHSEGLAVAN
eukprot:762741-Hanusia_phi.AAC.2